MHQRREHDENGQDHQEVGERGGGQAPAALGRAGTVDPAVAVLVVETTRHCGLLAHAAELAAEGVPVNVIQKQLGHVSLATTDIYLRHIAPADVIAMGRQREWSP